MALDPRVLPLLDFIGILKLPPVETLTPAAARARFTAMTEARKQASAEAVEQIRDVRIPGPGQEIAIRIYRPNSAPGQPALIYFHGGGWVLGDLDSHDHVCRALANRVPCTVLSVDYRLAPEHKFPAAVDDSAAAFDWIAGHAEELGIDPRRIAVGGDSAGGNLATIVCLLARQRGSAQPVFQLLIYPATDLRMEAASVDQNAHAPILTKATLGWFVDHYLNTAQERLDPRASPLLAADLAGLPPALVITAECDPLRDEGNAYGRRLQDAGVDADLREYAGMPHGFFSFLNAFDGGREAFAAATEKLRAAFGI